MNEVGILVVVALLVLSMIAGISYGLYIGMKAKKANSKINDQSNTADHPTEENQEQEK